VTRWRWLVLLLAVGALVSVGVGWRRHAAPESRPFDPLHLAVLNGTGRPGLARRVGMALSAAGLVVDRVGNAPHAHFRQTLLVANRLGPEAARALARRLGGVTLVPGADPDLSEDAILVLGADADRVTAALAPAHRRGSR